MPVFSVDDLDIHFPFDPYDVQKDLMTKVVECINIKGNGLLESPTGTGKTLSLLCAAVAWQKKQKETVKRAIQAGAMVNAFAQQAGPPSGAPPPGGAMFASSKIIYASRTHSQLSQAVQELKRSYYSNTRTVVLGSRDVMCIHEEVSRLQTSSAKNMACNIKIKARTCAFYNNVAQKAEQFLLNEKPILDIEDLVASGRRNRFCPFFMSREVVKKDTDVVFMPYNYLLDPKLRSSHGIDLQNAIIILDEGHNIAKTCEESVSFELKSSTVTKCIQEVTQTMNDFNSVSQQLGNNALSNDLLKDLSMATLVKLKQSFLDLEKALDEIELKNPNGEFIAAQAMLTAIFNNGFPPSSLPRIVNELDAVSSFQMHNNLDSSGCDTFSSILRVLGSQNILYSPARFIESYKVYITEEKKDTKLFTKTDTPKSKNILKVFNFWCFNPGLGLELVMRHGPRSIILASGTLSPLTFLESELRTPFPVKLSNPHIISDNQLFACVLKNGPPPTKAKLSSTFQNRNNTDYLVGLGEVIRSVCSIVPKGVLVFFPSYTVMDSCIKFWESSKVIEGINRFKKVFIEPRGKYEFNQTIQGYYDSVSSTNGGCLMAVCRGKVSEGLDFANDNGRAVIITGIPYSPYLDPHVTAKKSYLDSKPMDKGMTHRVDGRTWYQLEAVRALNQAVGRIIRHAQDYGAILLCDDRCDAPDVLKNLSPWLEKRLKKTTNFDETMSGLTTFFKSTFPLRQNYLTSQSQKDSSMFPGLSSQSKQQVGKVKVAEQEIVKDEFLSQMYKGGGGTSRKLTLSDDLFSNLSSIPTRAATGAITGSKSKTKSPAAISSDDNQVLQFSQEFRSKKRKHIKIEPVQLNYKSCDTLELKKQRTSLFSKNSNSHGTSSKSPSPSEKQFPSVKEFMAWVKTELPSTKFSEFVSLVKDYKSSKDIVQFSSRIQLLFDHSSLLICAEGMKYVLSDSHYTQLKCDIQKL